jgi:ASC-1-like (ASCH) protein
MISKIYKTFEEQKALRMDASKVKTWIIDVQSRWFLELRSGDKTVEGKRDSKTWSGMKVDDLINFRCEGQYLLLRIVDLRRYKTLKRYLTIEGLGRTLPGVLTLEEGIALYHEFWTEEEIKRDGILAIEVDFI